jgi:hypothetical protein
LLVEVILDRIIARRKNQIDISRIVPLPARRIRVKSVYSDNQAAIPHFFDPVVPCRVGKGIVMKIIGDTSVAGHFSRTIVYFPEPIAAVIHIRILIMHPGGHLPEHIAAVSQPFKIGQHLLRLRRAAFTYNGHKKE